MNVSQNGINLIKQFEGVRYKAYKDVVGLDTIGVGHLIKKDEPELLRKVLTEIEVDEILKKDLLISESCVNNNVKVTLNQNQFDSLVSLVFNIGCGNFKASTLLKFLNNSNYGTTAPPSGAAGQFLVWNKGGGKVVEGLKKRRLAESNLFSQK